MTYRYNPWLDIAQAWIGLGVAFGLVVATVGGLSNSFLPEHAANVLLWALIVMNAVPVAIGVAYLLPAYRLMRLHEGHRRR